MNILIPHSWLLEHLDTKATPQDIQKYLSLCGPSVERIYEREGEPVYDIEVTTNRVDSMSVRGIAREAAVILRQFTIPAKLKPLKLQDLGV
jgi:phenylalanyl-tRNA synthetase beta chain